MEKLTLNADDSSRSVRVITENVERLKGQAGHFRGVVAAAFEESDLNFLDAIAQAMGHIETVVRGLTEDCVAIQQALSKYVGEVADYSEDTTGLFN